MSLTAESPTLRREAVQRCGRVIRWLSSMVHWIRVCRESSRAAAAMEAVPAGYEDRDRTVTGEEDRIATTGGTETAGGPIARSGSPHRAHGPPVAAARSRPGHPPS